MGFQKKKNHELRSWKLTLGARGLSCVSMNSSNVIPKGSVAFRLTAGSNLALNAIGASSTGMPLIIFLACTASRVKVLIGGDQLFPYRASVVW